MFEQLPLVGDGLVMTRNEVAILGRRMTFPELAFTAHEIKGGPQAARFTLLEKGRESTYSPTW
jgi:hypothetical protein